MKSMNSTNSVNSRTIQIQGQVIDAQQIEPALYVVSTPIGNLDDISIRALKTLAAVDVIACEDTRHTKILTSHYGIDTKRISYNEHNANKQGKDIIEKIKNGNAVALVSDAGTPVVSDPGDRLVKDAIKNDVKVFVVPGANAALTAIVGSGLNLDKYTVVGFMSHKKTKRIRMFEQLKDDEATLVVYESPNRIQDTLNDAKNILGGNRNVCVARELTKKYETIYRGTLKKISEMFGEQKTPKGEIVLVIEGQNPKDKKITDVNEIKKMIRGELKNAKPTKVATEVAKLTGMPRSEIYRMAVEIKNDQ